MPLTTILQALEAEAKAQVAAIEAETGAEIARIKAEAQQQAQTAYQKHLDANRVPLKAEQLRILNRAKLQALQIVLGTREELISAALEETAQQLAQFSQTGAYADVLEHLTRETVAALNQTDGLTLRVKAADVPLMKQIAARLGLSATVNADLQGENTYWNSGLGGVIAATEAEQVSVINSLDVRLQRAATLHRGEIAGWLFDTSEED